MFHWGHMFQKNDSTDLQRVDFRVWTLANLKTQNVFEPGFDSHRQVVAECQLTADRNQTQISAFINKYYL